MIIPLQKIIKYKYPITIVLFGFWMLLFDGNSILFIRNQINELDDLKAQEVFLQKEIEEMKQQKSELFSDDDKLERYARENFFFKKDNEDVYVFEKDD